MCRLNQRPDIAQQFDLFVFVRVRVKLASPDLRPINLDIIALALGNYADRDITKIMLYNAGTDFLRQPPQNDKAAFTIVPRLFNAVIFDSIAFTVGALTQYNIILAVPL